jgi:pimeloyl-ACP methyl ester carboxylesterase
MWRLEKFLTRAGFRVVRHGYRSRRDSMATIVSDLQNQLNVWHKQHNQPVFHFVTHSLGGIVVRALLAHESSVHIGRIVMFAPPNRGSEIIDFWRSKPWLRAFFGRFMGDVALRLHTGADSLPNTLPRLAQHRVLVIAGTRSIEPWFNPLFDEGHDGKVSVSSARLNDSAPLVTLPVTHTFLMNNARARSLLLGFLRDAQTV